MILYGTQLLVFSDISDMIKLSKQKFATRSIIEFTTTILADPTGLIIKQSGDL